MPRTIPLLKRMMFQFSWHIDELSTNGIVMEMESLVEILRSIQDSLLFI